MDIFKDLVEELKEENLLEQTVIETRRDEGETVSAIAVEPSETDDVLVQSESAIDPVAARQGFVIEKNGKNSAFDKNENVADTEVELFENDPASSTASGVLDKRVHETEVPAAADSGENEIIQQDSESDSQPVYATEPELHEVDKLFYRQRAMDEVAALQMVEHVVSGVEREQQKSVPHQFDDLNVKRALHEFLKIADEVDSPEHAKAEFNLMQETESWCSVLSQRDKKVSAGQLRRYCESTKPTLSAQALISLARFYRNSPYSEGVRGKFDLILSKLFSKDAGGQKRSIVFENDELVQHLQELYADWSSVPLYSTQEDDPNLLVIALKFQDFIEEVNTTRSFDELIRNDLFNRLKAFKKETNENFFAPIVVSAAIECNIIVGNRFVDLIEEQRAEEHIHTFSEKYDEALKLYSGAISEATGKTHELLDLLQNGQPEPVVAEPTQQKKKVEPKVAGSQTIAGKSTDTDNRKSRVNKALIAGTIVVAIVTVWFFAMGTGVQDNAVTKGDSSAVEIQLAGTDLGKHINEARLSRATMYGIVGKDWKDLKEVDKNKILEEAVNLGKIKGFKKVMLLNSDGESVGYGSASRIAVY
jgi:hypothetical protein